MPRYALLVEIECGVETCDGCPGLSPDKRRCLYLHGWIEPSGDPDGGAMRLPDCLALARPVEEPEEAGERRQSRWMLPADFGKGQGGTGWLCGDCGRENHASATRCTCRYGVAPDGPPPPPHTPESAQDGEGAEEPVAT